MGGPTQLTPADRPPSLTPTPSRDPALPSPDPSTRGRLVEAVYVRGEFIVTIVMDGLVILAAIGVRWVLLWALARGVPAETETRAIRLLEIISDVSMVAAAGIFTAFDMIKRLAVAARSLHEFIRPGGHR